MHDYKRPPTLHQYAPRAELELALREGAFRLLPSGNCLTLGFSTEWDPKLFDLHSPADACLIIHNTEEFGERLHRAVQRALPNWAGIDGEVEYGHRSPLGAAFTKSREESAEREWQFAWRPMHGTMSTNPVVVRIGSIEQFAELRARDAYVS